MDMKQHLLKLQIIRKLQQQSTREIWPDEENGSNPFVHFIEAFSSDDSMLLDRSQGDYQLLLGMPLEHPDSILIEARSQANKEKSSFPAAPLLTPRDELAEHYQLLLEMSPQKTKSDDNSRVRQTIMSQAPDFMRAALASLVPIRAISQAVRLVAIQVMVEDQEGSVVDLALYNCLETSGLDRNGIIELIPVGQVLLVREPWLTRGRTGGHVTVRVDSPTDIIFLPPNHHLLEKYPDNWKLGSEHNVQAYKDMGNNAFRKGQFESAIRAYTNGLSVHPSASILRLNRSLCYLNINKPSMALRDARVSSQDENLTDALRFKAQYRMAMAYYALDQFKAALDILEDKSRMQFSPQEFSELEKKTGQRLVEQVQGNYDWFTLNKIANQVNGHRQMTDVADYVGPVKVARVNTVGGGRGLITTRDVFSGELLVVSKPFAFASSVEYPELFRVFHTGIGGILERANYELIGRAMQRLVGDHSAASALFLDLQSNPTANNTSHTTKGTPSFLTTDGRYWDTPGEYPIDNINVNQVEGIVISNSFSGRIEQSRFGKNEAIYLLPSMINHSCHGTAVRTSVGSIMVMRASRNLKAGEEITCSYVGGEDRGSFISRKAALKKWQIDCQCELCLADQKDGESRCRDREQYEVELDELRMRLRPGDPENAEDAKQLVAKIRSTYDAKRTAPMDTLGLVQRVLAFTQQPVSANAAIQLYKDALRSHGIHVKDNPPKKVPQNNSQLRRDSLIIGTKKFPSQLDNIFRCIKVMSTLAALETKRGKNYRGIASHWAVACLWVHEAFYGPGKVFLWHSLNIRGDTEHALVVLLKGFK